MYSLDQTSLRVAIAANVSAALTEDIASGDINAMLIPAAQQAVAEVITRKPMVLCGVAWVEETFRQVDPSVVLSWNAGDGDSLGAGDLIFSASGNARALLSGERTALNFIQLLSAVATKTKYFVDQVGDAAVELIDTRKTIPGLRLAQKYAVTCGGGGNHRMGLYDAFLIKENHISAAGGIADAVAAARNVAPDKPMEVEVENKAELEQALTAGADRIMLDNFTLEALRDAVEHTAGSAELEASGNVTDETLVAIAETGVDFISIGALTKHVRALDLSMRID